ncbi:MAG: patatin-like phospholipase family protein [Bacteroidales bacterium]|nr:patatin-like phospholipase family protein [Candidatus Liminaster caballi]
MSKRLTILLTLILTCCLMCQAAERPRVAVVLAGGGAKGLAHIGALKVIEESGVPIDIVVGNSMGSIVGGLYAIGFTPQEMDSVVRSTDWVKLLIDAPDFGNDLLSVKKLSESYQLRVSLDPSRQNSSTGRGGIIQGRNIEQLLKRLTWNVPDSIDFNSLPIPFACNATEAVSGKVYEFHSGSLVNAMRSSMAIPGVFTPVKMDSLLFVDGFVTNNYPVDVAKRLGADIVIGLDLVSSKEPAERYTNLLELVTHMIDVSGTHLYEDNIRQSDIYIDIDVTEYNQASFTKVEIDSMLMRGEQRARQMLPQLTHLRDSLAAIYGEETPRYVIAQKQRRETVRSGRNLAGGNAQRSDSILHERWLRQVRNNYLSSSINLGARFDNDEYASVQMLADVILPTRRRNLSASIYGRLGQRLKGGLSVNHRGENNIKTCLDYSFEHSDIQYSHKGNRVADVTSNHQHMQLSFGQTWHNVLYTFGLSYDVHNYSDMLVHVSVAGMAPKLSGSTERYLKYFIHSEFSNQNSIYFPTVGSRVSCCLELVTDNFYTFDSQNAIPIGSLSWSTAATAGSRFTFIPHASTRILLTHHNQEPAALQNVFGGLMEGMKVGHELTMAGIPRLEILSDNAIAIAGMGIQQRMGSKHYIQAAIDGCSFANNVNDFLMPERVSWGVQAGYSYSSLAGPISLYTYWSDYTRQFKVMLNVGFCF